MRRRWLPSPTIKLAVLYCPLICVSTNLYNVFVFVVVYFCTRDCVWGHLLATYKTYKTCQLCIAHQQKELVCELHSCCWATTAPQTDHVINYVFVSQPSPIFCECLWPPQQKDIRRPFYYSAVVASCSVEQSIKGLTSQVARWREPSSSNKVTRRFPSSATTLEVTSKRW